MRQRASARPWFSTTQQRSCRAAQPGDFDWKAIFAQGVRWFHSGGIFAALSPTTAELIIEGLQAAKAAGAVTSFDLNYRAKLWNISGGHDRAVAVLDRIVKHVDVLVGMKRTCSWAGYSPDPKSRPSRNWIQRVPGHDGERAPEASAGEDRGHHAEGSASTNRHSWGAVAWIDGATYVSPTCKLDVLDGWVAATVTRRAFSTACFPGFRSRRRSIWAGRTAHCSPPSGRHHDWPRLNKWKRWRGRLGPDPALICRPRGPAKSTAGRLGQPSAAVPKDSPVHSRHSAYISPRSCSTSNAALPLTDSPSMICAPVSTRRSTSFGPRQRVLVRPPDFTRVHSQAGRLTRLAYDYYGPRLTDVLPALGTHTPMTPGQIAEMFTGVPAELFRVHNWRTGVAKLGEVPRRSSASFGRSSGISRGRCSSPI